MRKIYTLVAIAALIITASCKKDSTSSSSDSSSSSSSSRKGSGYGSSGVVTAGEWNDLDNWAYWKSLLARDDYKGKSAYWSFFTNNRVSVLLTDSSSNPLCDILVELKRSDYTIWTAKTDNAGKAELWIDLNHENQSINLADYQLVVNKQLTIKDVVSYNSGINKIKMASVVPTSKAVEIAFIVDATGSMGDEISFLKKDLISVISQVKNNNPDVKISTATVFYRDENDAFVTRRSSFTDDINTTNSFINQQSADGGGDYPEAVHTALNAALNDLYWSDLVKTRIAFLLLDAPPHYTQEVIVSLQASIKQAAAKGIKLIPITASGIDKDTEFLMRFFAIATNGTYVFITSDSGVGGDHIVASVGDYQVEHLNTLLVRLITKYSK